MVFTLITQKIQNALNCFAMHTFLHLLKASTLSPLTKLNIGRKHHKNGEGTTGC